MSAFQTVKFWFVDHLGLAKDALHIYVGLALFLGSIALFGWRADGWKAWGLVVAVALAGEAVDIRDTLVAAMPVHPWANWHDLWNTAFWPTVIVLLVKAGRLRVSGGRVSGGEVSGGEGGQ